MIQGLVRIDEARIRLKISGPRGREQEIDAIIDTGYTGTLTLPPAVVANLGLTWQGYGPATLADGSECLFDVYEASVVWDHRTIDIPIDEADSDPLVGMELMHGYQLMVEVRDAGKVKIKRLS